MTGGPAGAPSERAGHGAMSVVLPAFNEAGNIGRLVVETFEVVPGAALGEVIVVDDASDDDTAGEVRSLLERYPKLRYLRHARRAGQSAAVRTGVRAARCELIATMDGDGQNDPRDLMALAARISGPGCDGVAIVGGLRLKREAQLSKRIASRVANRLRAALLADDCPDTGCGIKVFRRAAFLDLPYFSGMHRYLPALFMSQGHRAAYVPVNDRPRQAGQSKYTNAGRAWIGVHDLIGVRWLQRRSILPGTVEEIGTEASSDVALAMTADRLPSSKERTACAHTNRRVVAGAEPH